MAKALVLGFALLPLLCGAAHAGSNECDGTVTVGKPWTTIIGKGGRPEGCRVKTASPLGRRIIAVCPDGSKCIITFGPDEGDIPRWDEDAAIATIIKVKGVYRLPSR